MQSLQSAIKTTLGWCISLGTKIIKVAPSTTFTVQTASLSAQIFLLLTFFLPLKVLILLGSDAIPHYYPYYLRSIKKTHLIAGLSILTLICYLIYVLSEYTISHFSKSAAAELLKRSSKLNLFNNQKSFSSQTLKKFNRGLAAGIFSLVALMVLLYIYPQLFLATLAYLTTALLLTIYLFNKSERIRNILTNNIAAVLNTFSSVGFLVAFFFTVANFLYFEPPKIFAALISLLLMRQALSRLSLALQDIVALRLQHRQINALFFYGQRLLVDTSSTTDKIKNLLETPFRNTWILSITKQFHPEYQNLISSTWHQLGHPEIYAFDVELSTNSTAKNKRFLLKLFGENLSYSAEQEKTLISANPCIPSLIFCGSTKLKSLNCHVFELEDFNKVPRHKAQISALAINKMLLSIQPCESLALKYSRSHTSLEGRLSGEIINQLSLVATQHQAVALSIFSEKLSSIIKILSRVPKQIICLDLSPETLHTSNFGEIRSSHWANWKIEPIGSNWPITHQAELLNAIEDARSNRNDLASIPSAAVSMCSLIYTLEKLCAHSNFMDAINLLPEILEQLEIAETFKYDQR